MLVLLALLLLDGLRGGRAARRHIGLEREVYGGPVVQAPEGGELVV